MKSKGLEIGKNQKLEIKKKHFKTILQRLTEKQRVQQKNKDGRRATQIVWGRAEVVRRFATKHLGMRSDIKITCKYTKRKKTMSLTSYSWTNEWTNQQTDRPTDGQTAQHSGLVACKRLEKTDHFAFFF